MFQSCEFKSIMASGQMGNVDVLFLGGLNEPDSHFKDSYPE